MVDEYREFNRNDRFYAPYVASFCKSGDELDLWRSYGDDGYGFSLGFLISELRDSIAVQVQKMDIPAGVYVYKVIYDRDNQVTVFDKILQFHLTEYTHLVEINAAKTKITANVYASLNAMLGFFLPFIKHPCYANEQENRLVIHGHDVADTEVEYAAKRGYFKPYIDFIIEGNEFPEFPLHTVYLGPSLDVERSITSVRMLLNKVGLERHQIKVLPSNLPYVGRD